MHCKCSVSVFINKNIVLICHSIYEIAVNIAQTFYIITAVRLYYVLAAVCHIKHSYTLCRVRLSVKAVGDCTSILWYCVSSINEVRHNGHDLLTYKVDRIKCIIHKYIKCILIRKICNISNILWQYIVWYIYRNIQSFLYLVISIRISAKWHSCLSLMLTTVHITIHKEVAVTVILYIQYLYAVFSIVLTYSVSFIRIKWKYHCIHAVLCIKAPQWAFIYIVGILWILIWSKLCCWSWLYSKINLSTWGKVILSVKYLVSFSFIIKKIKARAGLSYSIIFIHIVRVIWVILINSTCPVIKSYYGNIAAYLLNLRYKLALCIWCNIAPAYLWKWAVDIDLSIITVTATCRWLYILLYLT